MKAYNILKWVFPMAFLFGLSSCSEKYKQKIEELKAQMIENQIDAQRREHFVIDSIELQVKYTLTQIDEEMTKVLSEEGVVMNEDGTVEYPVNRKENIISRVERFKELLQHNKTKVENLLTKIDRMSGENKNLVASLERTKRQLRIQESEVEQLIVALEAQRNKTDQLEANFMTLRSQNDSLYISLDELDHEVHKAFYVVGDYQKLKDDGVVEKEGGILSLGAAHVLNDDFDTSKFKKLDIRQKLTIPVKARKAELITEHPADSYTFNSDGNEIASLQITKPAEFWRAGKYMVLETR